MTQPPRRPIPLLGEVQLGERAARALTTELARHAGPKTALLVAATAQSPVLAAAADGLRPGDTLTSVPLAGAAEELRTHLGGGPVRVAGTLAEVDPADVVVLCEPLGGAADTTRGYLDELAKHVAPGGVLAVAVLALPDGATEELRRQAALYGAGTDLVLRNSPPVRVHRLRYTPGEVA